jgi:histidinol-phosphate/aromatic aminotransferase/cobyric acid decarboxylase-like protein
MEFVAPGAPAAHSPWPIDPGFSGILKKACQGDLVVLVNPVNPTGEEISRDLVFFLGRELFKRGAFLMIDESFQDFIGRRSSALPDWADLASSLFVLKSFTKISGLAGIRSGALFGPPKILSKIREGMGPWSLGRMEQEVIAQLISSRQGSDGQCAVIKALLDDLEALLVRRNLHVSRGAGPFLMIRTGWGIHAASRARQSLDRLGVRLRIASGFGVSDGEDWVRIGFQGIINPERIVDTIESLSGE